MLSTEKGFTMRSGLRMGFTLIELLVVIVIVMALVILTAMTLPSQGRIANPILIKDGAQLRRIHQSWLIFAQEWESGFPKPSNVVSQFKGAVVDKQDPENHDDHSNLDTTANLYSVLIMHNFYLPELCVGPTEPSKNVSIIKNYNYDAYNPLENIHWDDSFSADLDAKSHVSYAHMPLFGERMTRHWQDSMNMKFPIISNRGPKDGDDPNSITLKIHGKSNQWVGNVVFNDNHVEVKRNMVIEMKDKDGKTFKDHIFKFDQEKDGFDAILTFTKAMTEDGPVTQWD